MWYYELLWSIISPIATCMPGVLHAVYSVDREVVTGKNFFPVNQVTKIQEQKFLCVEQLVYAHVCITV